MSTIESLSIQGIRSFGTKPEDKQTITFTSPVTLILGANGCGKTTIIECLKYALTGEVPPGSGRGQSFIHDPKIFDFIECLGQAKLVTRNVRGENLTITRSMKIGMKRGKLSFENVDSAVCYGKDGNEKDMHSRRGIDVDVEMCQFMGVSKAIINNVIFCHQEDASWPLDEGKKLKEKFDAIFGTSEYNKAIDKFIKIRKEQMDIKKNKVADLTVAKHLKIDAENKKLELESANKKQEELQLIRTKLNQSIKPIEDRLMQIFNVEKEIGKIQATKIELETKLKNCREQIHALATKIKNIHNGDISQIDQEIRNFREKMGGKRNDLQNLEDQLDSIKFKEKNLQQTLTDLDRKQMNLINQRQQEQQFITNRAKKTYELCEHLKIPVSNNLETSSNDEIEKIFDKIEESMKNEEQKCSKVSLEHDKTDQQKQNEIDKYRESKATIESDIASKRSLKSQQENEHRKLETEINEHETNAKDLSALTEQIEKINKTLVEYTKSINLEEKKKQIDNKKFIVKQLQETFFKIDEKLTFLNSISTILAEISLIEKDLEKRELEVRRIKIKNSDNIKEIFPNRIIENNFKRNFQLAYEDLQRKVQNLNSDINKNRLKENELMTMRKSQKEQLMKLEKELQDGKDNIFDKCHSTPYEELLARSNENIQKYHLDYGAFKSAESMYKKYVKNLGKDPSCPLCHKHLSSIESADLSNEISDEIHRLPENINRSQELLEKEQKKYEELLSLKPIIDKIGRLEIEIPKMQENLNSILGKLSKASNEVENLQLLIAEPDTNLKIVSGMLGDMSLLDEAIKDVNRLQEKLRNLKIKLPDGGSTDSKEDVQLEKSTIASKLQNERSEVEKLQIDYEKENNLINKLHDKRNSLKDRQIKLQEGLQSLPQMKIQRNEIYAKIQMLLKEIKNLDAQLTPLKNDLHLAIEEKEKIKSKNRLILNQMNLQMDLLKSIYRDIQSLSKEVQMFAEKKLLVEIEQVKDKIQRYKNEQSSKAKENEKTSSKIDNLKMEISSQELIERDLQDNREIKHWQAKEEILVEENNELRKNFVELDHKNVAKEKQELNTKREEITVKKGELLGQIGELNNQINKIQSNLEDPKFRNAIINYRRIFYEVEILQKIINDLGQYRVALEWALMKFHSEKMEKINRLIREYWRQIYRGNDIDYIQIQTTDEDQTGGEKSADKKRSYNYKVVQAKHNNKIDMRGRCSAGQRVLASLIIRMALAETFSSNCGILALDEPTTNLDRRNILSLCEALNRIVDERQSQNNFMLIIITHDEEFISTLCKISSYYKVCRNDEGKSQIRKVKVA